MKEYWLKVDDKTRLKTRAFFVSDAIADIVFCHGFLEHSGRYEQEAKFFNDQGFNFLSYDQRNHGQSDGKNKALISNFKLLISDFEKILSFFEIGTNRPFFLMGHSMGGLVVSSYVLESNKAKHVPNGLLLSAPLFLPKADMAPILQKLSGFIAFLTPKLKTIKLDPNEVSSDKEQVKKYIEDDLIYKEGVPAKSGAELLKQMKMIGSKLNKVNLPFIIQHSQIDQLTEFLGSQKFYDEASSNDKELVKLKTSKHEILKDIEHKDVLSKFSDWMIKHL